MGMRIVFDDDDDNELECYLNAEGKVYIAVQKKDPENDPYNWGSITLDIDDVTELIRVLQDAKRTMEHGKESPPFAADASIN